MLNLDIDGLDFFTLISILKKYKPKVIITEFNEKIPYPFKYSIKNDSNFTWGWCHNYGYSVACIKDVMINFGYSIDSLNVNNIYLSRIDDGSLPNIDDVGKLYKSGYIDKKSWVDDNYQPWNKDVNHFHLCETEEEMEESFREYFTNNLNVNNGKSMIDEVIIIAKSNNQKGIYLNVNKYNIAKFFYEKVGFNIVKEEVIDIGNGFVMDDYVMELIF